MERVKTALLRRKRPAAVTKIWQLQRLALFTKKRTYVQNVCSSLLGYERRKGHTFAELMFRTYEPKKEHTFRISVCRTYVQNIKECMFFRESNICSLPASSKTKNTRTGKYWKFTPTNTRSRTLVQRKRALQGS